MPPFRRWLAIINKPLVILSEDVEHERARRIVGSIVDGTAIVTTCDLRGGRVCTARRIRSVSVNVSFKEFLPVTVFLAIALLNASIIGLYGPFLLQRYLHLQNTFNPMPPRRDSILQLLPEILNWSEIW